MGFTEPLPTSRACGAFPSKAIELGANAGGPQHLDVREPMLELTLTQIKSLDCFAAQ
jgi:hypothetical protein